MDEQGNEPRVLSGQVVALRQIDLAYEIDLKRAAVLWTSRTQGASIRSRLLGTPAKAVSFGVPPLELELGQVTVEVAGVPFAAAASVRLHDFGIAALALRLPANDMGWRDYVQLVNGLDLTVGPAAASDARHGGVRAKPA